MSNVVRGQFVFDSLKIGMPIVRQFQVQPSQYYQIPVIAPAIKQVSGSPERVRFREINRKCSLVKANTESYFENCSKG